MKYIFFVLYLFSTINALEFEKSKNIVTDTTNAIMWQDNNEVTEYLETSITAKVYCENIILNGYIDWRVPTINELITIIDLTQNNSIHKLFKYVKPNIYSTSSSFIEDDSLLWGVDFKTGSILRDDKENENYIRCVRDIL